MTGLPHARRSSISVHSTTCVAHQITSFHVAASDGASRARWWAPVVKHVDSRDTLAPCCARLRGVVKLYALSAIELFITTVAPPGFKAH